MTTEVTGMAMRTRVEQVSPAMARKWLEASEGVVQRALNKRRVETLAHAILSGQWQVTHQGIALTEEGTVLDGQHRLRAVVATDVTVPIMVTRGADPAMFGVLDTGRSRSPADTLRIAGFHDTNVLAAVVRMMLVYDQVAGEVGADWNTREKGVTTADILGWLEEDDHATAAVAAIRNGRRIAGAVARYGASTPLSAANLIVATYPNEVGSTTLAEFNERLCDGVMLGPRSPVLALRRWLVADTGYVHTPYVSRRISTTSIYLKGLNDYALGLERSLSIFRFGTEPIPLPLPPGRREAYSHQEEERALARERGETLPSAVPPRARRSG